MSRQGKSAFGRAWGNYLRLAGVALAIGALGATNACSALLGSDSVQCSTNGDCESRGFQGYTCGGDGVCVAPSTPNTPQFVAPQEAGVEGCTSAVKCTEANGGRPSICPVVNGQCLNLATSECVVDGDYANPNAIFLGSLETYELDTPLGRNAAHESRTLRLAHTLLSKTLVGGLPLGIDGARRPVVMVRCETGGNLQRIQTAARHLMGTVKASIVFAPIVGLAVPAIQVATETGNRSIVAATYTLTDVRQTAVASGDLSHYWQALEPLTRIAREGGSAKFATVEATVRARPGFSGNVRVAIAAQSQQAVYDNLVAEIMNTYRVNGKSLRDNGTDVIQTTYTAGDIDNMTYRLDAAANEIVAQRPHIIVVSGYNDFALLLPSIEAKWPAGVQRPVYMGWDSNWDPGTAEVIGGSEDLRKRWVIVGQRNFVDSDRLQELNPTWNQMFPGEAPLSYIQSYDMFMAFMYAIVAAGSVPGGVPNADAIVKGLAKLQAGPSTYTVPTELTKGMNALIQGGGIELKGLTFHPSKLDLAQGYPIFSQDVVCGERFPSGNVALIESGEAWDLDARKLTGTPVCPE